MKTVTPTAKVGLLAEDSLPPAGPAFVLSPAEHIGSSTATGEALAEDSQVKPWQWHLSRFLSRQGYAAYILVCAAVILWPGLSPSIQGTTAWRILLDFTVYEVILVDVLCKSHIKLHRPTQPRNGFPSGHATYAFGLAWITGAMQPRLLLPCLAVAAAVAWSRVYLRGHYVYQVVAGAAMGSMLAHFILWR